MVENHPGIIYSFSQEKGGFCFVSGRIESILGYSPSQIMENPLLWHDSIHPDDMGKVDRVVRSLKAGEEFAVEYRIKDREGKWHWFHDRSIGLNSGEDGIIMEGMVMDITARRNMEDELRESRHKYKHLVENIGPQTILFSRLPDGKVLYISPLVRNVMGLSPEEVKGRRWQDVVEWEPESLEKALPKSQRVAEGLEQGNFEISFFHKDGSLRTLMVTHHAIRDQTGSVTHVEGIVTDITDRKLIEQKKEHINKVLEAKVNERTSELENMNTALAVLLKKREEDKRRIEDKISSNYESIIIPFLEKIKSSATKKEHVNLVNIVQANLKEIISPFSKKLSDPMRNLTPSEIQVAALIRQGLSNKEIAKTLNNSVRTVTNHRSNIRKKLGLQNKKINLRSFLSNV